MSSKERKFRQAVRDLLFAVSGAGIALTVVSLIQGDPKQALIVALITVVVGLVLLLEV